MKLLVAGSVAIDTIKTPFGYRENSLGGSAAYFSLSSSFFTDVGIVAVVGHDYPTEMFDVFKKRKINIDGLTTVPGETFRWSGEYGFDLNDAKTLDTRLNVFATFDPVVPESQLGAEVVFLANIDPVIQRKVVEQVRKPAFVAMDTMNFWITGKPTELRETLKLVDLLIINDAEARMLSKESNIIKAAGAILAMGPRLIVIKRGEYGALLISKDDIFAAPAFPVEDVFDPTGAGDTFAGGFMGFISHTGDFSFDNLKRAVVVGTVMASYNVEKFSFDRLLELTEKDIYERYRGLRSLTTFADWAVE